METYFPVVSAVSLSPKGDFVAVGAWGDGGNAPTVVVFRISNGTAPTFTYVTPGIFFCEENRFFLFS
jgi:hypothetical protein